MALEKAIGCVCESPSDKPFSEVRAGCRVLRDVVVPTSVWNDYSKCLDADPNGHLPIFYLAHTRGGLGKLTKCLHTQLIQRLDSGGTLRKNYEEDLKEKWSVAGTEEERHRRSRRFMGKFVEFKVAAYLEEIGHQVTTLEAFGGEFDISTVDPKGIGCDIEVKYMGVEDCDFDLNTRTARGEFVTGHSSHYEDADYVLFRILQGALQLSSSQSHRVCMFVADSQAWSRVSLAFRDHWIDWREPRFQSSEFPASDFIKNEIQHGRCPEDLKRQIRNLPRLIDELRIISYSGHELKELMRPIGGDPPDQAPEQNGTEP